MVDQLLMETQQHFTKLMLDIPLSNSSKTNKGRSLIQSEHGEITTQIQMLEGTMDLESGKPKLIPLLQAKINKYISMIYFKLH